jgi:DNA-binding beta-propeller fold protein YncE
LQRYLISIAIVFAVGSCTRSAPSPVPNPIHPIAVVARFDPIILPRRLPDMSTVSTLAGSGSSGISDGPASRAQFIEPTGLAADRSGVVYVCDRYGQRIRRVARDGTVTTIAGGGEPFAPGLAVAPGYVDGPVAIARFNRPTGIAVASDGTLLIADEGNHVIRMIRNGVVSTYAGIQAEVGHKDGSRREATFAAPTSLTLDRFGNLYVADYPILRKIAPTGIVNTILTPSPVVSLASTIDDGNRTVIIALKDLFILIDARTEKLQQQVILRGTESLEIPGDVGRVAAYDSHTLVYTDTSAQVVRFRTLLNADDYTRPIAGTALQRGYSRGGGYRDGPGAIAEFSNPTGIAILPSGSIVVSDTGNRRIRLLSPVNVESAGKEAQLQTELPDEPPAANEFRIVLLGDSYVWTNVGWHESVGGLVADALAKHTQNCGKHVTVYVVRRPGLLPAPGFEYIDEVLSSGIASMVIYQLPQGGNAGYQIRGMIQKSAEALGEVGTKFMVTSFPESWDIPSESEFYRDSHHDVADLDRAYQWPKRQEFNAAIKSSGVDAVNGWPTILRVAASANHPNIYETGDIHFTPYGNRLVADQLIEHLEAEKPWGACPK